MEMSEREAEDVFLAECPTASTTLEHMFEMKVVPDAVQWWVNDRKSVKLKSWNEKASMYQSPRMVADDWYKMQMHGKWYLLRPLAVKLDDDLRLAFCYRPYINIEDTRFCVEDMLKYASSIGGPTMDYQARIEALEKVNDLLSQELEKTRAELTEIRKDYDRLALRERTRVAYMKLSPDERIRAIAKARKIMEDKGELIDFLVAHLGPDGVSEEHVKD